MKRGTPKHPKVYALCTLLKCKRPTAIGYLEMLWHMCAEYTPQGDIGKYSDDRIEAALDWTGQPGHLINCLVEAGWLDREPATTKEFVDNDEEIRHQWPGNRKVFVHHWRDHAEDSVRKRLNRAGLPFLTVSGKVTGFCRDMTGQCPAPEPDCLSQAKPEPKPGPHPPTPQPPPSVKPDRKPEACASDDARGVRAPISRKDAVSENAAATGLFQEFIGVFLAAGKPLNEIDNERARKLWLKFDAPEHGRILEHLKRSVTDGTWSDALHTPMPNNYLRSKAWTRVGPGRVLPLPPKSESKAENAQRRAAERFLRGER